MIAASRKHFWVFTVIETETDRPFMVYKFLENEFYPIVIQEVPWGVIAIISSVLTVFVLELIRPGGVRVHPLVKGAREVKSAILLFSFVPFWLHFMNNIFAVSYSKDFSFWQVLSIVTFVWIATVYAKKVFEIGTSVYQINFLHGREVYQRGKTEIEEGIDWVFDTYIDKNTKTVFR